jgi:SNF2 family DNA or RNA helicase
MQLNIEKNGYDTPTDEECDVCLMKYIDIEDGVVIRRDITLIQCGHYFCKSCVSILYPSQCPSCRFEFCKSKLKHITLMKPVEIVKDKSQMTPFDTLIDTEGTKTAHIIQYIKDNADEHIIVFCIWDKALMRIKSQLEKNDIRTLYCGGSVIEKDVAIKEFQHGQGPNSAKIMLLSAENCVSGVTLTRASKIIYITPFYGTPEFRRQQELQANGRVRRIGQTAKKIDQIWFLIKNSCEQIIDNANQRIINEA